MSESNNIPQAVLPKELGRYAKTAAIQEEFFKERLESALSWLESDIRSIRASLGNATHTYAENIVTQASRVQAAADKYRLHGENRLMLDDILAAGTAGETEPTR